jgi:DNA repair protein RadC
MEEKKFGRPLKFAEIPEEERPRERMMRHGPAALADYELVAAILCTGSRGENVIELSRRLLAGRGLEGLSRAGAAELSRAAGISSAKACRLVAAIEIGKRAASRKARLKKQLDSPSKIAEMLMPRMRGLCNEELVCICLDSKIRIIKEAVVSTGGLRFGCATPSDIFRAAVIEGAAAVILAHNHPSGDPSPSSEDMEFTKAAAAAGSALGIELLDHIIIGDGRYTSMKESGLS